jgi:hypothetical protein
MHTLHLFKIFSLAFYTPGFMKSSLAKHLTILKALQDWKRAFKAICDCGKTQGVKSGLYAG